MHCAGKFVLELQSNLFLLGCSKDGCVQTVSLQDHLLMNVLFHVWLMEVHAACQQDHVVSEHVSMIQHASGSGWTYIALFTTHNHTQAAITSSLNCDTCYRCSPVQTCTSLRESTSMDINKSKNSEKVVLASSWQELPAYELLHNSAILSNAS